jgi:hypothetical protein
MMSPSGEWFSKNLVSLSIPISYVTDTQLDAVLLAVPRLRSGCAGKKIQNFSNFP